MSQYESIQGPAIVSSDYVQKERNQNVQLLPMGANLGRLYCLVQLGTHTVSYGNTPPERKNLVMIRFEHPQLKQIFYVEDTKPQSSTSKKEATWNVSDRSVLRSLMTAYSNRVLTDKEAQNFDLAQLLGKNFNVQIKHKTSQKDGKVYEQIDGVYSPNGLVLPQPWEPELEIQYFFIDKDPATGKVIGRNFLTKNFADLPNYLRKRIMESEEAKEYASRGGKFAEKSESQNQQQPQQAVQQAAAPVQQFNPAVNNMPINESAFPIELINPQPGMSIQSFLEKGWTFEAMVENNYAKYKTVAPSTPPTPPSPPMPPTPPAPVVQTPNPSFTPPAPGAQSALHGDSFLDNDEHDDLPF